MRSGGDGELYTTATAAIAFNAAASTVAAAVQAAVGQHGETLPAGAVTATGGPLATAPVLITFGGAMAGPIVAQTVTATGLTGGTATFTRSTPGTEGGLSAALAALGGGPNPGIGLGIAVRGSDGKMYALNGIGAGDGAVSLQVYTPAQGTIGSGAPSGALNVGFKDVNGKINPPALDAAGSLAIQSGGTPGAAAPARALLIGGTDGTNLRPASVSAAGGVLTQSAGAPGSAAPGVADAIAGVDTTGALRAIGATTAGALATFDASTVPEGPISINGTAFTIGQSAAPPGARTVSTSSSLILPDSTGSGAINGLRSQAEVINGGNVDIWVCPSSATVVGAGYVLRPGGSLVTSYSGPLSAITNNTVQGAAVSSPSALLSILEWA